MPRFTPRKSPTKRHNEFARARAAVTKSGNIRHGLAAYKIHAPNDEFRRVMPQFLKLGAYRQMVWPNPTPTTYQRMTSPGIPGVGSLQREVEWAVNTLLPFADTLNDFIEVRERYERALLFGDRDAHTRIGTELQQRFGFSLWLLQSRINSAQVWSGLAKQKEFSRELMSDKGLPSILRYIISWISFRTEENLSRSEFLRLFNDTAPAGPGFHDLLHIVLGDCPHMAPDTAGTTVSLTDLLPLVDRYVYLVAIIQALIAHSPTAETCESLRYAVSKLVAVIRDPAIEKIALVVEAKPASALSTELIPCLDAYSEGRHDDAVALAKALTLEKGSIDALQIFLRSAERAGVAATLTELPAKALLTTIAQDLTKVIGFASDATAAASRLAKTALTHSDTAWAAALALIVSRQSHDERVFDPDVLQRYYALRASGDNPIFSFALTIEGAGERYIDRLAELCGGASSTCKSTRKLLRPSADHDYAELSDDHRKRMLALSALRLGNDELAGEILASVFGRTQDGVQHYESGTLLAEARLRAKRLLDCAQICTDMFLKSSYIGSLLPLARLVQGLLQANETSDTPLAMSGDISVVIVFDIYSRHVSPARDPERGDAFNDFLVSRGLKFASQLIDNHEGIPNEHLLYFLRYVCVPDVLDQCFALKSSREVEDERARILVQLTELFTAAGLPPPSQLNDELQDIRTRQVIRDTTHQLDQSKIFVDTDGIRRALGNQLRENWARYRLLSVQDATGAGVTDVVKMIQEAIGERIAIVSLNLPLTERNKLFERMVADVRDLFTNNKVFGLDANLSTNIRHGYVLRELRRPFVIAHLVTNKLTESSEYKVNEYWMERCLYGDRNDEFSDALNSLSKAVDEEIEYITGKVLRVWSDSSPEGVFDFQISHSMLRYLQNRADGVETYDEFLTIVFDFLWAQTDRTLEWARRALLEGTLRRLYAALNQLQATLEACGAEVDAQPLITAVNLVRPEIRTAVDRVASWFKLSGSRDYQDYAPKIAFDAALATVATYYSDLTIQTEFLASDGLLMRGWTLPYVTRVFSNLIENVAKHSGISIGSIDIKCAVEYREGSVEVHLENNISDSSDSEFIIRKVDMINANFGKDAASNLVAKEGSSGYPKIWKILAHDLRCDHELAVMLRDDRWFVVDILIDSRGMVL